jgi:tetratricopeptide (TPR) repeat protein
MRFALFLFVLLTPLAANGAATDAVLHPAPPPKAPLEELFHDLSQAESPEDAKPIEDRIGTIFMQSGSPSVDLLMTRAAAAVAAKDADTAKQLLETVTVLAPAYAEGWHARANLQRSLDDDAGAMVSLGHVILLNPRQFAAMYELGAMMEDYGDKPGALKLYRRALALDPQIDGAQKHIDALTRDVEGQGI